MRIRRGSLVAALTIGIVAAPPLASMTAAQEEGVTLTLLHNNDGESSLLPLTNAVGEDMTISVAASRRSSRSPCASWPTRARAAIRC